MSKEKVLQAACASDKPTTQKIFSWNWVVGPKFDLLWINGSAVFGFLYLFLVFENGLPSMLVIFCYLFVDASHGASTYVRTYFDRKERKAKSLLLIASLAWLALGPSIVLICIAINSHVPKRLYLIFVVSYAWWHVLRQHYGFFVQYQKRGGETFGASNRIDFYLYHIVMVLPLLAVSLKSDEMKSFYGLSKLFPSDTGLLGTCVGLIAFFALVLLILKSLLPLLQGSSINFSKILFIFTSSMMPIFLCFSGYTQHIDYSTFISASSSGHAVQYIAFVWHFGRIRYHKVGSIGGKRTFGLAHFCTRNIVYFIAVVVIVGAGWQLFGRWLMGVLKMNYITGGFTLSDIAWGIFVGTSLHHYYLDSKIWRVRKDFKLA